MDERIKVGDIVQLKSGGPDMTVAEIDDYGSGSSPLMKATCTWFDGTKRHEELFVLQTLDPVTR